MESICNAAADMGMVQYFVERWLTNAIRHVVMFTSNGMTDITHLGVAAMMHKCSTEWHAIQGPMFNTSD